MIGSLIAYGGLVLIIGVLFGYGEAYKRYKDEEPWTFKEVGVVNAYLYYIGFYVVYILATGFLLVHFTGEDLPTNVVILGIVGAILVFGFMRDIRRNENLMRMNGNIKEISDRLEDDD